MIESLIRENRSCRRFYQEHKIEQKTLKWMVNLARLSASAANLQPLRYILSCTADKNDLIFPCLKWAGYLKNWPGPEEGEKPSAYIIMLADKNKVTEYTACDYGIAAQSILLGAREKNLAGCMIASINRKKLRGSLTIPELYKILLVIALGRPKENVVLETVSSDGNIRYWRDGDQVHHVPKRSLNDIIIEI